MPAVSLGTGVLGRVAHDTGTREDAAAGNAGRRCGVAGKRGREYGRVCQAVGGLESQRCDGVRSEGGSQWHRLEGATGVGTMYNSSWWPRDYAMHPC
jgi:hypothetical protein